MRLVGIWRRVLGIATLWNPLAAIAVLAGLVLYPFVLPSGESLTYPKDQLLYFALGALATAFVALLTMVSLAFTTVFYAFHIMGNKRLSKRMKVAWSLLNVTLGLFVMPHYWYRHVVACEAIGESRTS